MKKLPQLEYSDESLQDIVLANLSSKTLVLTDAQNLSSLKSLSSVRIVEVQNTSTDFINLVKDELEYSDVIAVGGCRVLDSGRAVAIGKKLINVPTILSTSCLSCQQSVLYDKGVKIKVITSAPERTIIPMHTIMQTPEDLRAKWTASGIGDLFSRVSALIDLYDGKVQRKTIEETIPNIFEALKWFKESFKGYDYDAIKNIALYLHNASLATQIYGHKRFSVAGEHPLFDIVVAEQRKLGRKPASHGQIVSVGTLMSANLYANTSSDASVRDDLTKVYKIVGLPTDIATLNAVGIFRKDIIDGLEILKDTQDYLFRSYKALGPRIFDEVYK